MRLRTTLLVVFVIVLVIFLIQNNQDYSINFLFIQQDIPGSIFVLVTVLLSFLVGFLVGRLSRSTERKKEKIESPQGETL